MNFYVVVKKTVTDNTYLPTYSVAYEQPEPGVKNALLTPGDCVCLSKCSLVQVDEVRIEVWKISNVDGQVKEEHLETFSLEKLQ